MNWFAQLMLLVILAFLPPLIYAIWIRDTERCHRQQWGSIAICFLWGASIAVVAAFVLEATLGISLSLSIKNQNSLYFITVVFLAPVVEEFTKPLALRLRSVTTQITELEDGLIYGAVAGLGFSATENLFYGFDFFQQGLVMFLIFMALRSFGGCLLHASATSLTGYGYGKALMKHSTFLRIIPYFILAICVHGFYNFLLSFDISGVITGLALAFLFVGVTITIIRNKIRTLDKQTC